MQKLINRGHVTNKGFTLIELLVVIAIIGILAGIVLASLGNARGGANNAKVQEQLNSTRNAMEAYYASNNNYGVAAITSGCNSATPFNDTNTGLSGLTNVSNYPNGTTLACYTAGGGWAVSATLTATSSATANPNWCVDSTGASKFRTGAVSAPPDVNTKPAC